MLGRVIIRQLRAGVIEVATEPRIKGLGKKFFRPLAKKPFDRALGYAAKTAAIWRLQLVDETGKVPAEMCAALVEELRAGEARGDGAGR